MTLVPGPVLWWMGILRSGPRKGVQPPPHHGPEKANPLRPGKIMTGYRPYPHHISFSLPSPVDKAAYGVAVCILHFHAGDLSCLITPFEHVTCTSCLSNQDATIFSYEDTSDQDDL